MSDVKELDELIAAKCAELDTMKGDIRELRRRRDIAHARGEIIRKLGLANDAERKALQQLVGEAGGIENLAAFGSVGGVAKSE